MSAPVTLPPETERELFRLDRLANAARNRGDLVTEATCKIRWVELYRATGAVDSPAPKVILSELQEKRHRTMEHVPMWRIRQRLSPLVAIVRVEEKRYQNARGGPDNYFIEHLSCGHQHVWCEGLDYPNRSKRRRCKECGDAAMLATGYTGEVQAEPRQDSASTTVAYSLPVAQPATSTVALTVKPATTERPATPVVEMPKTDNPRPRRLSATAARVLTVRGSVPRD